MNMTRPPKRSVSAPTEDPADRSDQDRRGDQQRGLGTGQRQLARRRSWTAARSGSTPRS